MSKLKQIHDYLINRGKSLQDLLKLDKESVYLSMEIMEYAHRNQKRENGEDYAYHPSRVMWLYRNMINMDPDDYFSIDYHLLAENEIPYEGVQEVCLLHDVIEDSDLTIEDVKEIFYECGFKNHFDMYILKPLINVTHIKTMPYEEYIEICKNHITSALVKMLDMQDNINVLSLIKFDEKVYKRTSNYLKYMFEINEKYHFIENIEKYKKEYKIENE